MTYVGTRAHGHRKRKVFGVRFVSIKYIIWMDCFLIVPEFNWNLIIFLQIFTEKELLVLEYAKDLNSFSENGPSHDLNKKVHCPSVLDMMKHLTQSNGPKVTTYFTHSPALLLHLTAMGAYARGEPLTAYYSPDRKNREWNTSKLSPMAANFAAVLYKKNKVKFFLNDKVVHLPIKGCTAGLCDLKSLQSQFNQCTWNTNESWQTKNIEINYSIINLKYNGPYK